MRIVIDIPQDLYDKSKEKGVRSGKTLASLKILGAIANGTPLPKGHGRLIDADELYLSIQTDEQQRLGEHLRYVYDEIQSIYTVLEADKESANE